MEKKSLIAVNRGKAFAAYCSCGGNISEALKELKRQDCELTAETLKAWEKKYNFPDRLTRADALIRAETMNRGDMRVSLMLSAREYERYMSSVIEPDPQVTYAILAIYKMLDKLLPEDRPLYSEEDDNDIQSLTAAKILQEDFGLDESEAIGRFSSRIEDRKKLREEVYGI